MPTCSCLNVTGAGERVFQGLRYRCHGTLFWSCHMHGFGCVRKKRARWRAVWCALPWLSCEFIAHLHALTETNLGPLLHESFDFLASDNECDSLDSFHPQSFDNDNSTAPAIFRSPGNGTLSHQSSIHPVTLHPVNGFDHRTSSEINSGNDLQ